jgi:phosphodiesterase/alkaline phosphatase D-like protein
MRASATAFLVGLAVVAAGSPDLTAQVVQITRGPVIETASNNSATIAWSTNQPSDSRVWYGTDKDNLTQTGEAGAAATTHRVQLNNLQPNATYYFRVESSPGQGRGEAESPGVLSFKTVAQGQPPIHNQQPATAEKGLGNADDGKVKITNGPILEYVDSNSATIAWSTNLKGSTRVTYGTDPNNLGQLAESPWGAGGLTHRVKVQNLHPSTTYYFQVETGQAEGTGGAEVEGPKVMSLKTTAPGAPPLRNQPAH